MTTDDALRQRLAKKFNAKFGEMTKLETAVFNLHLGGKPRPGLFTPLTHSRFVFSFWAGKLALGEQEAFAVFFNEDMSPFEHYSIAEDGAIWPYYRQTITDPIDDRAIEALLAMVNEEISAFEEVLHDFRNPHCDRARLRFEEAAGNA